MSGIATAVVATAVIGGAISSSNTNKAIDAQNAATNAANAQQQGQYNQTRTDMAPWRDAGTWALGQLQGLESSNGFKYDQWADPGFQFRMQQGEDAIKRATANRGGILAGSTLGSLTNYAQGLGSQEYQNAFGRYQSHIGNLQSMAGLGINSAAQTASAGMNAANNISGNLMNMGNAQGAAYITNGNTWNGALNNMSNQFMNYQLMNRMYPTTGGTMPTFTGMAPGGSYNGIGTGSGQFDWANGWGG